MMMVAVGSGTFSISPMMSMSLGLLGVAELIPYFICALFAGHVVDTYSRRMIATISSILHLLIGIFLMFVAKGYFEPAEF
jgi:MFS family permease